MFASLLFTPFRTFGKVFEKVISQPLLVMGLGQPTKSTRKVNIDRRFRNVITSEFHYFS